MFCIVGFGLGTFPVPAECRGYHDHVLIKVSQHW